jgi:hypothetical protein
VNYLYSRSLLAHGVEQKTEVVMLLDKFQFVRLNRPDPAMVP